MRLHRPNLLFLYTDEQRADTLVGEGAKPDLPHLARLASQSLVFERAYATQAVCTPSRSSLLTGLWPHQNGCTENNIALRPDTPCLPELVQGYRATGHHGKWHLGDEVFAQHGFHDWISIEDYYAEHYSPGRDRSLPSSYSQWLLDQGRHPRRGGTFTRSEAAALPEELSKPAYLASQASRFLRAHTDEPWILYVNFLEPHMPFTGPRNGQYAPEDIRLPANFEVAPTQDQPLKARLLARHFAARGFEGMDLSSEKGWRRLIANYWGLCSLIDTYVGAILETLRGTGQWEDTIIVFTSDHGDMMGSHRLLAKCVQFEEAVRIPLLIKPPGPEKHRRIAAPVSHIDLIPTLLELLDQPVPESLPGRSLLPLAEGKEAGRDVFIPWNGGNNDLEGLLDGITLPDHLAGMASPAEAVAASKDPVRTVISRDGWKITASPRGEHEVYDLGSDPQETRNLAAEKAGRERLLEGCARLRAWQAKTGDITALIARENAVPQGGTTPAPIPKGEPSHGARR